MRQLIEQYEISNFGRISIMEDSYLKHKYSAVGEHNGERIVYGHAKDIETTISLAKITIADGLLSKISDLQTQARMILEGKNWKKINIQEPKNTGSGK